jgi:ADP-ribosylglycohydrolase
MTKTHEQRLSAAHVALEGLSIGDAIGRQQQLESAPPPWRYSDDTEMAIALLEVLALHRSVNQDALAAAFARRFEADPERGYGAVAYWQLYQLTMGHDWRTVSVVPYQGQGSLGNGAAMRVAPVGAYFADDLLEAARQAQLSAAITHAHPDGQAGAIAVAIAAAYARARHSSPGSAADAAVRFIEAVLKHTPDGPTRAGIARAASLDAADPAAAASVLGDGTAIRSSDTVPLAIWCAAHHLDSYEAAILTARTACHRRTADRDTICAIVGSIVVRSSGIESIPAAWRAAREPLPV